MRIKQLFAETGSILSYSGSLPPPTAISSSYAVTASHALNGGGSSDWNSITGKPSGLVSSSIQINTGSFSGSFSGSASYSMHSLTSSYALASAGTIQNAVSASYALTASYALNGGGSINFSTGSYTGSFTGSLLGSSSYAFTSSYSLRNAPSFPDSKPLSPSSDDEEFEWTVIPGVYTLINSASGVNSYNFGMGGTWMSITGSGGTDPDSAGIAKAFTRPGAFNVTWKSVCNHLNQYVNTDIRFADSLSGLNDNSTGKMISFQHQFRGTSVVLIVDTRDSTSWNFGVIEQVPDSLYDFSNKDVYLRASRDNSNVWSFFYSFEGKTWRRIGTTTFNLTISHVAFSLSFGGHNAGYVTRPAALDWVRFDWEGL